jgi:hypothetical protein
LCHKRYSLPLESPPVLVEFHEKRFFVWAHSNSVENTRANLLVLR